MIHKHSDFLKLELQVEGGCDRLRREPKLGPLEMQQEFLIADPSHQPN